MASLISNPTDFSPKNDIMYGVPKPYGPGKKVPVLNKKTKRGLVIRCPWLLTYGANGYVNPKSPNDEPDMSKVSMSLQFPRDEFGNDKTQDFLKTVKEMEEQILNDAFKHCRDWLGQAFEDVREMKALYTPILKYPMDKMTGTRDKTRPPTMQIKIPLDQKTSTYRTEVFNMNRSQLYPSDEISIIDVITKGCMVACNLYCAGIWLAGGKFGVIWNLSQAMVKPSENFKKGECYIPLVDEEGNVIDPPTSPIQKCTEKSGDISDGEDESQENHYQSSEHSAIESSETITEDKESATEDKESATEPDKESATEPDKELSTEPIKKKAVKKR
jgi:hypothetical protein